MVAWVLGQVETPPLGSGVLQPAQGLMVIVPDDAGLEIEAMIENKDIGFVEEGRGGARRGAVIKMEAFPFTRYGTLKGQVTGSPTTLSRTRSSDSSSPRASPCRRPQVDDKILPLSPGMLASVKIKTGSCTLMEYILSPIMKAMGEAGRER